MKLANLCHYTKLKKQFGTPTDSHFPFPNNRGREKRSCHHTRSKHHPWSVLQQLAPKMCLFLGQKDHFFSFQGGFGAFLMGWALLPASCCWQWGWIVSWQSLGSCGAASPAWSLQDLGCPEHSVEPTLPQDRLTCFSEGSLRRSMEESVRRQ